MDTISELLRAISMMLVFILLAQLLKRRDVLKPGHLPLLTVLVVDIVFPAFLFYALAHVTIDLEKPRLPLYLAAGEFLCLFVAWLLAGLMRLGRKQTGAFLLAATFGSTSFLGIPIIQQVMAGSPEAMADAVISLEFGMSLVLVTVGVAVAMHYGQNERGQGKQYIRQFFRGPVFGATVLGLIWSVADLPKTGFLPELVFHACELAGDAMPLLAGLCVGLMLRPIGWRDCLPVLAVVIAIKSLLQPLVVGLLGNVSGLDAVAFEVIVILAAMPAAAFTAVLSERFGCDGALATTLVVGSLVAALATVPLSLFLLQRMSV